ncbi:MAG TPA: ATPase domain-containing protein [Thermomicrobiales bacterium]|nr:ATPase domain-containing protein [Thermomicrobiales bacterium]
MGSDRRASSDLSLRRHPTRVPGLDDILGGGLIVGDTYLVTGTPGTGKTTLGNQLAFTHAAQGGSVLFATLMTESHDRMLAHMQEFSFFDRSLVGDRIRYLSLMVSMQDGDFEQSLRLIVDSIREHRASLLVIDGAGAARLFAQSEIDYLRFIHGLDTRASVLGCTTVFLSGEREAEAVATHVDGVLQLSNRSVSARDARWLRVSKLRGSDYLNGQHRLVISDNGIAVYPRIESVYAKVEPTWHDPEDRLAFGVPSLDAMAAGGVQVGTATLVLGTPGAGKTLLGLHFLSEGARRGERGILAGFHETPPALASTAERANMGLLPHLESGLVQIMWRPPFELAPDEWAWQLLRMVDEHRPQRLVIDAYSDLIPLFTTPDRRTQFAPALANQLRDRDVTALIIFEVDAFAGTALTVPVQNLSASLDNGILLRTTEVRSSLRRLVSILKQRQTGFDTTIREFSIGENGIVVGAALDEANLLTGSVNPNVELQ